MKKWFFVLFTFLFLLLSKKRVREKKTISIEVSWKLSAAQFFKRVFRNNNNNKNNDDDNYKSSKKTRLVKNSNFNPSKGTIRERDQRCRIWQRWKWWCFTLRIFAYCWPSAWRNIITRSLDYSKMNKNRSHYSLTFNLLRIITTCQKHSSNFKAIQKLNVYVSDIHTPTHTHTH